MRDLAGVAVLVLVAVVAMSLRLDDPVRWTPDALFYRAQLHELRGDSRQEALRRTFSSRDAAAVAAERRRTEPGIRRVDDPDWVRYSSDLYRRRWTVPLMASALYPVAGERSLVYVSMLGYVAFGLLLFALLRRRFGPGVSLAVTAACLLLPPLRRVSALPLTDSWGLALEVGALLAAVLALERGKQWIAVWAATMLALSFTRDATAVLLVASAAVLLSARTRRSAAVFASGVVAALPAPLLFNVPLVEQMAYTLNDFRPRTPATLSYVGDRYPEAIWSVLRDDLTYPSELALAPVQYLGAAALVIALVYMLARAPWRDEFFTLQRGAVLGALATIAIAVNYSAMRIELVLVPPVAAALAFAVDRLVCAQGDSNSHPA